MESGQKEKGAFINQDFMIITQELLDDLTVQAKQSPKLRKNLDLRNSEDDKSQRMLNAVEPGSSEIIHRHRQSSETVVVLRGHFQEKYYNEDGSLQEVIDLIPGGSVVAISVPKGQWHTARAMESATVVLACKDGPWEPMGEEDVLSL